MLPWPRASDPAAARAFPDHVRTRHRRWRNQDRLPAGRRRRRVRASARGPGANLQSLGELEVEKVLHEVMEQRAGRRAERPPAAICLGIAGVDRPHDNAIIRGIMRRIGHKAPVLVVNDALAALVAGAGDDGPGIVLIAGTGIDLLRPQRGRAGRARRRVGLHPRRRGQRLVDRPPGAVGGDAGRSTDEGRRRC